MLLSVSCFTFGRRKAIVRVCLLMLACLAFLLLPESSSWADSHAEAIFEMAVKPRRDVESMCVEFVWHKDTAERKDVNIRLETLGTFIRAEARYEGELIQQSLLLPDFVWDYSPGSNMITRMSYDTAVKLAIPCVDPRLIGIVSPLHISDTFAASLDRPYEDTRVIGLETVDSVDCTVVRTELSPSNGLRVKLDQAIDERSGRVYRITGFMTLNGKEEPLSTTLATFGEARPAGFDWLPTSVTNDHRIAGVDFLEIDLKQTSVDERRFTLAGMDWPVGVSVSDKEAKKRLGYWNGKEIVPHFPLSYAGEVVAAPNNYRHYYVIGAIAAFVTIGSFLFLRRRNA